MNLALVHHSTICAQTTGIHREIGQVGQECGLVARNCDVAERIIGQVSSKNTHSRHSTSIVLVFLVFSFETFSSSGQVRIQLSQLGVLEYDGRNLSQQIHVQVSTMLTDTRENSITPAFNSARKWQNG
jgi:hypothetical protein